MLETCSQAIVPVPGSLYVCCHRQEDSLRFKDFSNVQMVHKFAGYNEWSQPEHVTTVVAIRQSAHQSTEGPISSIKEVNSADV